MATVKGDIRLNDYLTKTMQKVADVVTLATREMEKMSKTLGLDIDMSNYNKIEEKLFDINNDLEEANRKQDELNEKVKNTASSYNNLGNIIKAIGIGAGIKKLVDLSDQTTQIEARLGLMSNGMDVGEMKNKIFASAQNSRANYLDQASAVASLGMQAGEAFGNDANQIIAFTENLNKMFTTSGMDSNAISSVMYNMTQSLSTGALLGQDYRIIKQNAPQMIQYLQDFYGVNRKELDDMVSKGQVTAQGLKNAIFKATDDINKKFENMPLTWGQVWTSLTNRLVKASEPLLNVISLIAQHWSELEPIVVGLTIAVGTYVAIKTVYNTVTAIGAGLDAIAAASATLHAGKTIAEAAATTTAAGAQAGLNAALLACPLTWIIIAIVALVGVLVYLWNTNDKVAKGMLFTWDSFLIGLDVFALGFKGVWYGLLDFLGYFKIGALGIIDGFINSAIWLINQFISMLNLIPGVSIDAISYQSTLATDAAAKFAEEKAERDAELANDALAIYQRANELNASRDERVENRKKLGFGGTDTAFDVNDIVSGLDGLDIGNVDNVSNIDGTVDISSEDLKILREMAEQQYIQNYISNEPVVYLNIDNVNENADVEYLISGVASRIREEIDSSMEGVPVG